MASFYDYFKENMEELGLPAPETLYGNLTTAIGTAAALTALIDKFGARVTVRELIGAGLRAERLMVIGGCLPASTWGRLSVALRLQPGAPSRVAPPFAMFFLLQVSTD